jgi:hypothetical protein
MMASLSPEMPPQGAELARKSGIMIIYHPLICVSVRHLNLLNAGYGGISCLSTNDNLHRFG